MSIPDRQLDDDTGLWAYCHEHGDYCDIGKGCQQCLEHMVDVMAEEAMEERRRQ